MRAVRWLALSVVLPWGVAACAQAAPFEPVAWRAHCPGVDADAVRCRDD